MKRLVSVLGVDTCIVMIVCAGMIATITAADLTRPSKNVIATNPAGSETSVKIIEVGGHRFAIAQGYHETAICEVTDRSLIKTNDFHPSIP